MSRIPYEVFAGLREDENIERRLYERNAEHSEGKASLHIRSGRATEDAARQYVGGAKWRLRAGQCSEAITDFILAAQVVEQHPTLFDNPDNLVEKYKRIAGHLVKISGRRVK